MVGWSTLLLVNIVEHFKEEEEHDGGWLVNLTSCKHC